MLIPHKIPEKEPTIRVGIVLPEDRQVQLTLHLEGKIKARMDGLERDLADMPLAIRTENDRLYINGIKDLPVCDTLELASKSKETRMRIFPVIAGRRFHWKKEIEVRLTHKLEIKIHEGMLLVINELPLEDYVASVATSEMSEKCPDTFLGVQTIVARSWMLANVEQKHIRLGFDVCNDDCCQRFQGTAKLTRKALKAANRTRGQVLLFDNTLCDARYSKSCGGVTERFENLWEGESLPYFQNRLDADAGVLPDLRDEKNLEKWVKTVPKTYCSHHFVPEKELTQYLGNVDEKGNYFRWQKTIDQQTLLENIHDKLALNALAILDLVPIKRGGSGRMLELRIDYLDDKGQRKARRIHKDYPVREVLHPEFLYSSACIIEKKPGREKYPDFHYTGAGWGHGAGMCQIGALGMALAGYDTDAILAHYYPGSALQSIYP
jgi:SpoIID/LytB domain protein